jgi:UDP-N-acetylglucosamine enolpyruvyl transferase
MEVALADEEVDIPEVPEIKDLVRVRDMLGRLGLLLR